jgi:hypothetical protein
MQSVLYFSCTLYISKYTYYNQTLVGTMIDVGLSKDDYSSISATVIERGLEPLDAITYLQIKLGGLLID